MLGWVVDDDFELDRGGGGVDLGVEANLVVRFDLLGLVGRRARTRAHNARLVRLLLQKHERGAPGEHQRDEQGGDDEEEAAVGREDLVVAVSFSRRRH